MDLWDNNFFTYFNNAYNIIYSKLQFWFIIIVMYINVILSYFDVSQSLLVYLIVRFFYDYKINSLMDQLNGEYIYTE